MIPAQQQHHYCVVAIRPTGVTTTLHVTLASARQHARTLRSADIVAHAVPVSTRKVAICDPTLN